MLAIKKAITLLEEWSRYENLHYSNKASFANAINIEIAKDEVQQHATVLREVIMNPEFPNSIAYFTDQFEKHLDKFEKMMVAELLISGIPVRKPG